MAYRKKNVGLKHVENKQQENQEIKKIINQAIKLSFLKCQV